MVETGYTEDLHRTILELVAGLVKSVRNRFFRFPERPRRRDTMGHQVFAHQSRYERHRTYYNQINYGQQNYGVYRSEKMCKCHPALVYRPPYFSNHAHDASANISYSARIYNGTSWWVVYQSDDLVMLNLVQHLVFRP